MAAQRNHPYMKWIPSGVAFTIGFLMALCWAKELEAVAFGWHPGPNAPPTQWFCIDGGAHEIVSCMEKYIRKNNKNAIKFNSRVTAIGVNKDHHAFSHVISTIPLPVLRTIDLSNAGLLPLAVECSAHVELWAFRQDRDAVQNCVVDDWERFERESSEYRWGTDVHRQAFAHCRLPFVWKRPGRDDDHTYCQLLLDGGCYQVGCIDRQRRRNAGRSCVEGAGGPAQC
ncbi:hypothetical protein CY34DRAFT_17534 [Suillus luteus UH-Slu-Lm8-n1]|uniref:Uncharacterized protein n=1 Tax=Suillus luteus UH-Slu-Lm8-n1 TaxID=930992 RepID=A0A0D0ART3_9AGAM|nr:hypothetical protein CY34DRAFT_17534 [Suillus luteus UH-Slu-Lm8-n1]